MNTQEFLPTVTMIALVIGILTPNYIQKTYSKLYERTKNVAITKYGDNLPPLTREENSRWYLDMKTNEEERPDRKTLKSYLNLYKLN